MSVSKQVSARIPNPAGAFQLSLYHNDTDDKEHLALILGEVAGKEGVLVRVHSECFTGDVLGSLRCDCGEQLQRSMEMIAAAGTGVLLYLRQEGRGIGLLNKLRAYNLQDEGYDTVEANLLLGHQADEREYTVAAQILEDLDVRSIRLLTNNPEKISALQRLGVRVTGRVSLTPGVNPENARYLHTKIVRMNHLLSLNGLGSVGENGNGKSLTGNG
jgi:3,4-dihydroxy 2-butanone 4-phosphate synthase/GTP cyclohydrolase II